MALAASSTCDDRPLRTLQVFLTLLGKVLPKDVREEPKHDSRKEGTRLMRNKRKSILGASGNRVNVKQVQAKFHEGLALYQKGQLARAQAIFEQILKLQFQHFEALHLLGVIAARTGKPGRAVELIGKAIEIHPNNAAAYNNRGNALVDLKQPQAALESYDRSIALKPDFADAFSNRGRALLALNQPQAAVESCGRAIALKPDFAVAYFNRGNAFLELKQPQAALESYDRAIALSPDFAQAFSNRSNALMELRQPQAAVEGYDRAIALKPDFADAFNNRGRALLALNQAEAAVESCGRAITLKPDFAAAYYNRGNALLDLKQPQAALESYDRAIALRPDYAEAFNNRSNAFLDLKQPQAALESYDRAIALRPDYAEAFNNRSNALRDLRQPQAALESYDRAIALRPDFAQAFSNRGNAMMDLRQPQAALESYDRAIALRPDFAQAFSHRGNALRDLEQPQAALDGFDKAIALQPDYAEAYQFKGLCLLLLGRFDEGWRHYEWRKQMVKPIGSKAYYQPVWLGQEDIAGKTLFIHCEQGLGDTIQFCRYVKLAEARGARVILSAQDSLMRLLRQLSPTVEIIGSRLVPLHFDYHIPLLSTPLTFKTDQNNIPAQIPYLRAEPDRVERWKDRTSQDGLKIGIAWQGSQAKIDLGRSFSVTHFSAISRLPNVRLISLQKNAGVEQLSDLPPGMKVETLGDDFDAGPDAFIDTAAVMESLDLIITSDTSIAHLAGALGRPTWVALKHVPDWRWQLERTDSPWYPTIRLFRQTSRDDWASVFAEMQMQLARRLASVENNLHMSNPLPPPMCRFHGEN
jgi:tetratricopeptide (TPR) repeat protein